MDRQPRRCRSTLYKKKRIASTKALFGDVAAAKDDIRKLAHFGTTPFAVVMTIPDSLAFHQMMGVDRVAARLHYLKIQWVQPLMSQPGVEIVTPAASQLSGAIASFRITGKTATQTADLLYTQHNIMTVGRTLGPHGCVRVTPSIYNSIDDCKKLVAAVKQIVGS
ncbi:MAG: aminotransferase class V-fold PLP-dependent enzyme [Chitinophagaceae bacterium]